MNDINLSNLSRRRFVAAAGLGAAAAVFAPRLLIAQETGIVPRMINEAARAKIKVHRLRRNISVVEGSGGNIAVLTGRGGKLLIDSGFTVSRARIAASLDSLSSDPPHTADKYSLACRSHRWKCVGAFGRSNDYGAREYEKTSFDLNSC